ncbi:MAG: DUF4142 domain-containing protein [Candidatus Pseudobacter hemicellulosilyticus]|uniref:DUF4142 domain-containing protein n=1 Tax=Candidatus Pseudobacter hemicellulosilyticus TaxID=3121375 RepID=A0AAJ6BFA2_9BACT|nr:MAG: DUF4142 domain-containing protein [Pseudobacter sp.]
MKPNPSILFVTLCSITLSLAACNGNDDKAVTKEKPETAVDSQRYATHQQSSADFPQPAINHDQASTAGVDTSFVGRAVRMAKDEVAAAEEATQKSTNGDIKKLAATLKADHQRLLKGLAAIKPAADTARNTAAANLNTGGDTNSKAFDRWWVKHMLESQQEAISSYEQELGRTTEAPVKGYISQSLPVLRAHVQQLEAVQKKIR